MAITSQDNKFEGVISPSSLANAYVSDKFYDMGPAVVNSNKVVCATPDDSLDDVAKRMKESGHKTLPVLSNGAIKGIITSFDLLQKMRRDVHIQV